MTAVEMMGPPTGASVGAVVGKEVVGMLRARSKAVTGGAKTLAPAGNEVSTRAAEIAADLVERATEVAQRAVEGAREAAPVVLSTAATAAESLGVAAEKAAEKLTDTAERLSEPSKTVADAGRERLAGAAEALAQAVRPRRRRRGFRRAVVIGGVVGASVGLYVSPIGRKVRETLGGGATEQPPESIPLPATPAAASTPTEQAETARQTQPAGTGGDGVLTAKRAGSSEPED